MHTYQTVYNMIEEKTPGVLVTFLNVSPTLNYLAGQHWIWNPGSEQRLEQISLQMQDQVFAVCQQVLQKGEFHRTRLEYGDEWIDLMLAAILPAPRLVIFGCGYVGQAVARVASLVGWEIVVVDDRPTFANPGLFPDGVKVICSDFVEAVQAIQPGKNDYCVIVTRGHQYDRIVLTELAGRQMAYLGMIGSKRRVRDLLEELVKEGVEREWLDALYSPIGLTIGAETPEEIAISIMAEIIQVRRKGAVK